jgi:hypothetical protein
MDYEGFTLVTKWTFIRAITFLVAKNNWKISHLDVNTSFLNGDLKGNVFMESLLGFKHEKFNTEVCKLNKTLYGFQTPKDKLVQENRLVFTKLNVKT